jgi:Flp pilus assembly protein TadD
MTAPLVSIIIRSADRAGLGVALRSVAAQSYSNIEVIVVASGSPHLDVVPIEWKADTLVRRISRPSQISHEQAANIGMAAARGDFFAFLDDHTSYESHHVQSLVEEAKRHPNALLVYARGRRMAQGDVAEQIFGRLFNRALFFFDTLFYLQAALIDRRVIALGCHFDESLDVGSEHDFLKQIALHGDFVFLADTPPVFNMSPDRTAPIANGSPAIGIAHRAYAENAKLAKWTGERLYHTLRSSLICARAAELLRAGKSAEARCAFLAILNSYPDDPDALHGMAICDLAVGNAESAQRHILGAIDLDLHNIAYRDTANRVREKIVGKQVAPSPMSVAMMPMVIHYRSEFSSTAVTLQAPLITQITIGDAPTQTSILRMAMCGCGSRKRYKSCCSSLNLAVHESPIVAVSAASSADESIILRAQVLLQAGNAERAALMLAPLQPQRIVSAELASKTGDLLLQMHRLQPALTMLARALELTGGAQPALAMYNVCCELILRPTVWRSASRTLQALYNRLNSQAQSRLRDRARHIHIVAKLDSIGGTERRALNLYRFLAPHITVTLWSTTAPLAQHLAGVPIRQISADDVPINDTLVLVGTYFDCGEWLEKSPFDKVVICHNLSEQYPSLMERMIQLEENPSHPIVRLTFPSRLFMDTVGLPGLVEHSAVDLDVFRPRSTRGVRHSGLVVGRHGRAYTLKFHPNDPTFFRRLIAKGHTVRLLGGTIIAAAFADDKIATPELLAIEQESPRDFLETLDVFIYRKHPKLFETGGNTILEAMAMALPVIVFVGDCGVAELIVHGENGFLVDSEDQAVELLDRLAADPSLRESIGRAARASIVELMSRQAPRAIDYYLGSSQVSADQDQLQLSFQ